MRGSQPRAQVVTGSEVQPVGGEGLPQFHLEFDEEEELRAQDYSKPQTPS